MLIVKMDANGRVPLPLGLRYKLDLNAGDKLHVDQLEDGTMILKKLAGNLIRSISSDGNVQRS